MADFDKVPTGHERWPARNGLRSEFARKPAHWPIRCDFGTGQSRAGLGRGPWPSMGDRIKRFCAPVSSLVVRPPGRPLPGNRYSYYRFCHHTRYYKPTQCPNFFFFFFFQEGANSVEQYRTAVMGPGARRESSDAKQQNKQSFRFRMLW